MADRFYSTPPAVKTIFEFIRRFQILRLSALLSALAPLAVMCLALPAVEFMFEKFVILLVLKDPWWFFPLELLAVVRLPCDFIAVGTPRFWLPLPSVVALVFLL